MKRTILRHCFKIQIGIQSKRTIVFAGFSFSQNVFFLWKKDDKLLFSSTLKCILWGKPSPRTQSKLRSKMCQNMKQIWMKSWIPISDEKSVKKLNTKKPLVHLHCTSNYHFEIFKKVCILNSNNFTTKPKIDNIFSSELDKSLFKNNSLKRCLFPSTKSSHAL